MGGSLEQPNGIVCLRLFTFSFRLTPLSKYLAHLTGRTEYFTKVIFLVRSSVHY